MTQSSLCFVNELWLAQWHKCCSRAFIWYGQISHSIPPPPPPWILQAPRFSSDPVALTTIPWQWFTESGHLSPANQPCEMSQISPLPHYMVPGYPPLRLVWFVLIWDPGLSQWGGAFCVACPVLTQWISQREHTVMPYWALSLGRNKGTSLECQSAV